MAIYNEILAPRYSKFLQKLFGMKGQAAVRQLAGEITAGISLFNGAENRFMEGWDRFGRATLQAAVAAQTSRIQWRNPVGSGVVAVFEKLTPTWAGATADAPTFNMGAQTVDLATIDPNVQVLDPRGRQKSTIIVSLQAAAGGGIGLAFAQLNFGANQNAELIFTDNQEIQLLPGQCIQVASNAVNIALLVSAVWRERALEPSELLP